MEIQKVLHLYKEEEKKKPNINHSYMVSEKLDGWYCFVDYTPNFGFGHIYSSAYRVIPSFVYMKDMLNSHYRVGFNFNFRLIMEAVIPGLPFHIMNGLFNRTLNDYQCFDTVFYIHDIVSDQSKLLSNYDRFKYLNDFPIPLYLKDKLPRVDLLGISDNKKDWFEFAEQVWSNDGEGVILKQTNGVYCPGKRNSSLMKIKLEEEFDLLCVDFFKTIGEKGNDAFNLKVKNKKGTEVVVKVGKFSDIAEFETNSPISKVVTIKCMKQLEDGSYREPRFKCVRYDKRVTDID